MGREAKKGESPRFAPYSVEASPRGRRDSGAAVAAFWFVPRLVPEARRPLNVVLVTADTLRADRLPGYGYEKVETPNLDRMAASGALFEQATTVVPLTLPAHSSMFTGTFPMHHGVRDNGGYYLGQDQVTLAETLKENGYQTGGFVAAFVLDSRWGLNQGFDKYYDEFDLNKYENVGLDTVQRRGGEVLSEAVKWMDSVKEDRFFAWLHFYDVHTPYEPPEPFLSRYKGYPGSRYDGEIAYLDSLMGELFDWLQKNDSRGGHARGLHRGPWRESRTARGEHPRFFHLRRDHARAVSGEGPLSADPLRHPYPGSGEKHRSHADDSGSGRDPAARDDPGHEPRPAPRGRERRSGTPRLQRVLLSAAPLRMGGAEIGAKRPDAVHRRAAPGALRHRSGPAADEEHRRSARGHGFGAQDRARRSRGTLRRRGDRREGPGDSGPRHRRPARRSRLSRRSVEDQDRSQPASSRSQGQDRPLQPHQGRGR